MGSLYIDGAYCCMTLEDTVRDTKIYGETAIPSGTYQVLLTWSPKFQRDLPILQDVPGFTGVRIHVGNTPADTEGCILVGRSAGHDSIAHSRLAFEALYAEMRGADGPISIEILDPVDKSKVILG